MKKDFTAETVSQVLGDVEFTSDGLPIGEVLRTPLHVEFNSESNCVPSERTTQFTDASAFNAVGSRLYESKVEQHLPVLDVDGGARVQVIKTGSKAILFAHPYLGEEREKYAGKYGATSLLRDVLGDNNIDLEVFLTPIRGHYGTFNPEGSYLGNAVTSLALRSKEPNVFAAVDSTQEHHNHLYIQTVFEGEDHRVLIEELGKIGIISGAWQRLTELEGMGIVRTPWTKREGLHKRSG